MKIAGIILTLILISSCITQKRCLTKYPPIADTVKITQARDSIILRDTTIYIKIPGESLTDSIMIPCPEIINYIAETAFAETPLAKAWAWWQYPEVRLKLIQKDTTIETRLEEAIREAYHWKSEYNKITKVPDPVRYIPKLYQYSMMFSAVIILSVILWIASKFIKIVK